MSAPAEGTPPKPITAKQLRAATRHRARWLARALAAMDAGGIQLREDHRRSLTAVITAVAAAHHAGAGLAVPTEEYLLRETGLSRATIYRHRRWLLDRALVLEVEVEGEPGREAMQGQPAGATVWRLLLTEG